MVEKKDSNEIEYINEDEEKRIQEIKEQEGKQTEAVPTFIDFIREKKDDIEKFGIDIYIQLNKDPRFTNLGHESQFYVSLHTL